MRLKVRNKEVIVSSALILINIYYGLNSTTFYFSNNSYLLFAAIGLFAFHVIIFERLNLWEMFLFLVLISIYGINYIYSNDSRVLMLLISIIAIKNMNLQRVLKIFFVIRMLLFCFTIIFSLQGVIPMIIIDSARGRRYAMGFTHPNQFMVILCMLIMMYVCLYWEKINSIHLFLFFVGIILGHIISKSNTGIIVGLIILAMLIAYKYFRIERLLELLGKYIPIVLMFLSLFLPYTLRANTDNIFLFRNFPGIALRYETILRWLDNQLSNRLTLSRMALRNTDFDLFGSRTDVIHARYTLVDSGYIQLLLVFGIGGCVVFFILNWFMVRKMIKEKQYIYIWAFIGLSLYGFVENTLCSLAYNFILIFIVQLFESKEKALFWTGRVLKLGKIKKI